MGSGVVVSKGYILTNNHVIEGADEIRVTTPDKREYKVEVVGSDPKSDLAVLKVGGNSEGLVPIPLGDSSELRLGDVVIAIGNPFGVGQTVTMGIVSAKGRANVGIVDYEDFIQTDAAINPGNSGGALINMRGELVGINTAIMSRTGGNMGIGFAIPTNMARPIMQSLIEHGKVVRGWLGVVIQEVDAEMAQALNLASSAGVLVSDVQANSPAQKAGLSRGDVILEVDGRAVNSTGELRNLVAAAGANVATKLTILRAGKRQQLTVRLGELPAELAGAKEQPTAPGSGQGKVDGFVAEDLNALNRKRFEIPVETKSGVVITEVEPGTAVVRAGVRPGDVILEVNRRKVASVAELKEHWRKAKGRTLLLLMRDGVTHFLVVKR
jgi:serine protease Do